MSSKEERKKIFLSGDWLYFKQLKETASALEKAGYEIQHKWWERHGRRQATANMEFYLQQIEESDAFVLDLRGVPEDKHRKHAGGHIGMGFAMAQSKPVFFLGQPESSLYSICATTTEGLLLALETEFNE